MNRGFLYGDGFFESIRIVNGHIPLLSYHLRRIQDAMGILEMESELELSEDYIQSLVKPHDHPNHVCRLSFYREGEGKYAPMNNFVAIHVKHSPINEDFWLPSGLDLWQELKSAPERPGTIISYPTAKPIHPLYTVKSLSSAFYVLAAKYKVEQRADYALLLNSSRNVIEELSSNLLFVKDEEIYTVPKDSGHIKGTCLRYILHLYGFQITEKQIELGDIDYFDAIYSCKGTTGVQRIK